MRGTRFSVRKRILVTGGGGFLGRYIVRALLRREYRVAVFNRSDHPDLAAEGVEVIRGDITDAGAVTRACEGIHAVFHVAAKAGVWGDHASFHQPNVVGTRYVLAACKMQGVARLVYTSTPSVVFTGGALQNLDETAPYGSNWLCHYAATKAAAEQEVLAAHDPDELRTTAIRPHLIWGIGDPHLVPRVLDRARRGRLRIVGDGENRVDITHVENAAAAHLNALDALDRGPAGGRAFFVSQGEPVRLWHWINDLLQACEVKPVRRRVSFRTAYRVGALLEKAWTRFKLSGEPPMTRFVATELAHDHFFNIAAAREVLGYQPTVSTADGLQALAEHLRGESGEQAVE